MSFVSIFSAIGIRIFIMAFIWTVLDYIAVCKFWKSPFLCRYNADFFWKLTEPNSFENIFGISCWLLFAEPCLLAVHRAEFVKG
jgi:hypothetical protein